MLHQIMFLVYLESSRGEGGCMGLGSMTFWTWCAKVLEHRKVQPESLISGGSHVMPGQALPLVFISQVNFGSSQPPGGDGGGGVIAFCSQKEAKMHWQLFLAFLFFLSFFLATYRM
jgi:hypothetical protein